MICANPKCGNEFTPNRITQKSCSKACNEIYQNNRERILDGSFGFTENRVCAKPGCKKMFEYSHSHPNRKWCSEKCRRNFSQNKISKENREFLTRGKHYHCPVCDKDFIPKVLINQKCCSDKCSKDYYRIKHVNKPEFTSIPCACCGQFFKRHRTSRNRIYCSSKCRNKAQRINSIIKYGKVALSENEKESRRIYKRTKRSKEKDREYHEKHKYREQIYGILRHHKNRIAVADQYVKSLIAEQNGVSCKAVTHEMVEAKKLTVAIYRQIQKIKQNVNEHEKSK